MSASSPVMPRMKAFVCSLLLGVAAPVLADDQTPAVRQFLERHCFECHDADVKKGGLDLTALTFDLANGTNFAKWVLVHDRVSGGEMPPKKKARPDLAELQAFTKT